MVELDHEGKPIGTFGSEGDEEGQFRAPRAIGASGPVLAVCSGAFYTEDHQRVTVYGDLELARGGEALRRQCAETSWMEGVGGLADLVAECVVLEDIRQWGV